MRRTFAQQAYDWRRRVGRDEGRVFDAWVARCRRRSVCLFPVPFGEVMAAWEVEAWAEAGIDEYLGQTFWKHWGG